MTWFLTCFPSLTHQLTVTLSSSGVVTLFPNLSNFGSFCKSLDSEPSIAHLRSLCALLYPLLCQPSTPEKKQRGANTWALANLGGLFVR